MPAYRRAIEKVESGRVWSLANTGDIYGGIGSASCQSADGREEPEVVTSRDGHLFAGNSNYL